MRNVTHYILNEVKTDINVRVRISSQFSLIEFSHKKLHQILKIELLSDEENELLQMIFSINFSLLLGSIAEEYA